MPIRAAALILACLQVPAWGQRQYSGLRFPPYEIFQALTGYAEDGSLAALSAATTHLPSLTAALDPGGERDLLGAIRRAAASGDRGAAARAVRELVGQDLRFNLAEFRRAPGGRKRDLLQMAFMDYHFLSAAVRARDPALDRVVRRAFKTAYRTGKIEPLESEVLGLEAAWRSP